MSIFSDNVTSSVKVKDLYGFLNVSFSLKDFIGLNDIDTLNNVIRNTFSNKKIVEYINEHNTDSSGYKILDRPHIESFCNLIKNRIPLLDKIFVGLILVLLLSDGFEDRYLQDVYNTLIYDYSYKNGSRVGIKIIKGEPTSVKFWVRNCKIKVRFSIDLESINKSSFN